MTEPQRLLSEPTSVLDRTLIESVMGEQPSESQRRRVRMAVGLGAGLAVTAALGRKAFAATSTIKVAGVVLAVATVGGGVLWSQSRDTGATATNVTTNNNEAPIARPGLPTGVAAANGDTAPATPVVDQRDSVVADEPLAESTSPSRARQRATPLHRSPDLADRIRAIDVARAAVAKHDSKAALAALDAYESKFPEGAFDQEAAVLRMEAIDRQGDHDRAVALARAFLAKNPSSPHVTRVRRILDPSYRTVGRNTADKQ